jgi:hypothetical protein
MLRVIANGIDLDLYQNTEFWITKQVHDLRDLNTRNGDIARSLTIPRTAKNENALRADFYSPDNRAAYIGTPGIVTYDGIDLIQNGLIYWNNLTRESIDIVFYYANTELFNSLGEKLEDLNLNAYNFTLDLTTAYSLRAATTGVLFPRLDWCTLESSRFLSGNSTGDYDNNIDLSVSGFVFYLATLIEEIIEQAGFTLNTDQVDSSIYDTLALAIPLTQFAQEEALAFQGVSDILSTQNISFGTGKVEFTNSIASGITWNGTPNFNFTIAQYTQVQIYVNVTGTFVSGGFDTLYIRLRNPVLVLEEQTVTSSGPFSLDFNLTSGSEASGVYYIEYYIAATGTAAITSGEFRIEPFGANSRDIVVSTEMPDITQAELLKGFLALQNLILKTNPLTKEVSLFSLKNIKKQISQDWSNKLLMNYDIQKLNSFDNYGIKNNFLYSEDKDLEGDGYDAYYLFDDERLQKYADLVELPFQASDTSARFINGAGLSGVYDVEEIIPAATLTATSGTNSFTCSFAASMKVGDFLNVGGTRRRVTGITSTTTGTVSSNFISSYTNSAITIFRFKPKKNKVKIYNIVDNLVNQADLTDGDAKVVSYPTEKDAVFGASLRWNDLIEDNYTELMAALNRPLIVTAYFIFDLLEFSQIDFFKPVYVNEFNALFYINKIEQYKPNKPVRVELIRL